MPPFEKLIQTKNNRLSSIPDKFITQIEKVEAEVYASILALINKLETREGLFIASAENLRIAAEITSQLKEVMLRTDYTKALVEFAREFDLQAISNQEYFSKAFKEFTASDFTREIVRTSKKNAVKAMLNGVETSFAAPVGNALEQAIINNSSYSETIKVLKTIVTGNPELDSTLVRHSKTLAREAFAVSDRAYSSAVSDELGIDWFWYSGGLVGDSRKFCVERVDQYFHRKELEAWGSGKRTPGFSYPQGGIWQGHRRGTNSQTIFTYLGGWNCMHSSMGVSALVVPKKDLKRAIKLGYFKPNKVELELL